VPDDDPPVLSFWAHSFIPAVSAQDFCSAQVSTSLALGCAHNCEQAMGIPHRSENALQRSGHGVLLWAAPGAEELSEAPEQPARPMAPNRTATTTESEPILNIEPPWAGLMQLPCRREFSQIHGLTRQ
jgi:hypothetical protein